MTDITVLMPYYNTEEHPRHQWVKDAVASIMTQSGISLNLIVVDNGSTSHNTLQDMGLGSYDHRFNVLRYSENTRDWLSHIKRLVTTEYCCIMCDDDLLTPGALDRGIRALTIYKDCGAAFGTDTMPPYDTSFNRLFVSDFLPWPGTIFRTKYLPLFDKECVQEASLCNDWAFWLEIAHQTNIMAVSGGPFVNMRLHADSDTERRGLGNCEFAPAHLTLWRSWLKRGHHPTPTEWSQMLANFVSLLERSNCSFRDGVKLVHSFNKMRGEFME